MARTGISLRIHGALNARGNIINFRQTTMGKILDILDAEVPESVNNMREDLYARFEQGEGNTAGSLVGDIQSSASGAKVRISIGDFGALKYMTTLVPDSDFRAIPYPIVAKRQFLNFFWKKLGRRVSIRRVQHPGFGPQDTLRQSAERDLSRLGYLVEYQVRSAVAEVQSGGRTLRVSGRR